MKIYVRYCGGCRSGYDRAAWVRALLAEMGKKGREVSVTAREEDADICVAVCGCAAQCIRPASGMHMVHAPYVDGISMDIPEAAAYLLQVCE